MTPQQAQTLNQALGPWLEKLGYLASGTTKRAG
jgi:hypothetical protein